MGGGTGRSGTAFLRALAFGAGAAALGTIVWSLIINLLNMELGLIAIGVGLLVGVAVRKGARGRGGWKFQTLAMALTYMSITASYVPMVVKALRDGPAKADKTADGKSADGKSADGTTVGRTGSEVQSAAGHAGKQEPPSAGQVILAFIVVFGLAFASPFLSGASNIMGIIIIAIALYEAWKINRRVPVSGPFRIGSMIPAGAAPPPAAVP